MRPDAGHPILIIGAGASGLSTAAALAKRRIRSTVLDLDDRIGGTWARRYERLQLHTVRRFSGLAHYSIPKSLPRYLSKDEYADYVEEYAKAFSLDVSLGERVDSIRIATKRPDGLDWQVETSRATRRAAVVVVATGHYAEPRLPTWEGLDEFEGTVLHSSAYTTGALHAGQRALVVGLGNSGAEIAADLVERGAASVSISVRTPPPIVTRELFGFIPTQLLGIVLTPIGMPRLIDRCGAALRRIGVGDLSPYGLGKAAWGPFTARRPAVIDAGFLKELKQAHIAVRPDVSHFDQSHVTYADGSSEAVDVVVAATGFGTGLSKFLHVPGVIDEAGQPRFRSGRSTPVPGLYFVGFDETVRGHLFEANRDSKRLAVEIERYLEPKKHGKRA